jgi:hypothetical protein
MPFEDTFLECEKVSAAEKAQQQRRVYLLKSLMQYGFTEEQANDLLKSLDEYVAEKKDLTEEEKDSLYKE